jgi:hypothetical protein
MSSALTEPGTATETRPGGRRPLVRLHGFLVEFAVDPDGHVEMYQMEAERAHEMMRRYLAGDRIPTIPEKL